jgi:xanthine dehydrogenase YagS FAD-binding subunit
MKAFAYYNPKDIADAVGVLGAREGGSFAIAGGTDLLGEIKNGYVAPERVVNLKAIKGLDRISSGGSGLKLGPLVKLSTIAADRKIRKDYPALAQSAESVGSPQLRNMGTLGGNICQRPRCWYYRGEEYNCIRKGGGTCFAVGGRNKYHCIIEGGPCFIVHPSDVAVALRALDASVTVQGAKGSREVKLDDFFVLPTMDSLVENILKPGELITEVKVPRPVAGSGNCYLKFKERGSRDFALVSAGVVIAMNGDTCTKASIVLGGVSPAPFRAVAAEAELAGKRLTAASLKTACDAALADADPLDENAYKIDLTATMIKRAVLRASGVDI